MARITLGSLGSAVALAQARDVASDLAAEWPDDNFGQRSFGTLTHLLDALHKGQVSVAVCDLTVLSDPLPEALELAAVTKRVEPRSALISKNNKPLSEFKEGDKVGTLNERDAAFARALNPALEPLTLSGSFDDQLAQVASEQVAALVLPCAHLIALGRRQQASTLLEPEQFPPAAGQGCVALLAREDDDMAHDFAYSLQHRPSFDRITAERAFVQALSESGAYGIGALATVSSDGDLTLFGAVTDPEQPLTLQAESSGEASEAEALGKELAHDVLEQLRIAR